MVNITQQRVYMCRKKKTIPDWLLLDSRVVDVLRLSNLMLVTLSSLQPFFFNGLKKALHFSANVGA